MADFKAQYIVLTDDVEPDILEELEMEGEVVCEDVAAVDFIRLLVKHEGKVIAVEFDFTELSKMVTSALKIDREP